MVNKPNENCTISENNKSNYNYATHGQAPTARYLRNKKKYICIVKPSFELNIT